MTAILGAGIRYIRKQRGLLGQQLAAQAQICPQHMSEVEIGKREPSVALLARIEAALGMTAADLVRNAPEAEYCHLVRNAQETSDEDVFCTRCPERVPAGCQGVCVPAHADFDRCPAELREECPCCYPPTPDRLAAWEAWGQRRKRDAAAWQRHDWAIRERRWELGGRRVLEGEWE